MADKTQVLVAADGTGITIDFVDNGDGTFSEKVALAGVTITNPMTHQDALIVGGAAGTPTELQKGTSSQALGVSPSTGHLAYLAVPRVAVVALVAADTAGGIFSWQNPEAGPIFVARLLLDVTTVASGACTIDAGATAASGTTLSDTLVDGVDAHTAAKTFDNLVAADAGTNGKTFVKVASGKWITGSTASGASAGLVGFAYIHYTLA